MRRLVWAWTVVGLATAAAAQSVTTEAPRRAAFTEKPAATRLKDGQVEIAFAVSAPTDVEVAVVDGGGTVVRHLAAGVLGGANPPPAPLKPGLAQRLLWDGMDDAGRPLPEAAKGPFTVRVRAGLTPAFEDFMLFNPDATPRVQSLAVAPGGNLYVFYQDPTANGNQGGIKLKMLDRQGRHVRQIVPFAADLPYEKVKATGAFQDTEGRLVPQVHNWHTLSFYPDTAIARRRTMSAHSCPVADARGRLYWIIDGGRLASLDPDGSLPYETFLSEPLFPDVKDPQGGRPALCLTSDGTALYASGVWAGAYDKNSPVPCVYRIDPATRKAEVFLGKPDEPGKTEDRFTSPRGVCAAKGLLYVADPDADRVAVFNESDRALVGEIKVQAPHLVQVHPTTGAVYVCTYLPASPEDAKRGGPRNKDANLIKYADYKSGKELYQLALPRTGLSPNYGTHRIALDASADPPLIWAPGIPYGRTGARIGCYRDTGTAFEPVEISGPAGPWADGPRDLLVDRARGELYIKVQGEQWHQLNESTGALVRTVQFPKNFGGPYMGSAGSQLGLDAAGNYITHCWGQKSGLMRWSRDLQPLNWLGQDTHRTDWGGMMTFQLNYMAIRQDEMYVIKPVQGPHHLDVYDMGLNRLRRVVWNVRRGSCPRVDAKGNVYITVPIRPADRDFPEFFDGKLGNIPDYFRNIGEGHYWYTYMYGSIVKFPPEGGAFHWIETDREKTDLEGLPEAVAARPKVKYQYFLAGHYPHRLCEVQGADWVRFGYSPYSETYSAGTPVCMCEGTGFEVDPYGRVFYPNLCQFRVEVIDNNNNPIGHFGHYGNQDSGPSGRVKTPSIPLAWPTYVAVSDTHAYVNDTVNMRVVRVKLGSAAEGTCAVPAR